MALPAEQLTKNEEILEAARAVFILHGIRKATMDDIAKTINITRTALYYYYKNKQELLAAVLDQEILAYRGDLADAVGRTKPPVEKLVAVSSCYCDFHRTIMSFFKFDTGDYIDNYEMLKDFRESVLNTNEVAIMGVLSHDPDISSAARAGRAARLLGMALRGVVFNSMDMDRGSLRRALAHMCRIFYFGLRGLPRDISKP